MQQLVQALNASLDPVLLTRRIAEQMCLFTPQASGASVSICAPDDTLVIVSAHGITASLLGRVTPMAGTFQDLALRSRQPEVIDDARRDARLLPTTRALATELDVRSWVAIPMHHNDNAIGALSVVAAEPFAFAEVDVAALASLSQLVSALIGSHSELSRLLHNLFDETAQSSHRESTAQFLAALLIPGRDNQDVLHDELEAVLAPGNMQSVFQPILNLRTGALVGLEGLCRFPESSRQDAGQWFSSARRLGRGIDLERRALETILGAAGQFPRATPIAVNLSPLGAMNPDVQDILLSTDHALVVEITEYEPFPDDLGTCLAPLRGNGIRIAVDDVGAGYANLNQILRLRPDIIKIDGELTTGIENDPVRRALTTSIVRLAEELGASTVAEAIESDAQRDALQRLGIHYGQGFHLARPAPGEQIVTRFGHQFA